MNPRGFVTGLDEEVLKMLGIEDPSILVAYGLSFGLALLCIVYGVLNWNKGGDECG